MNADETALACDSGGSDAGMILALLASLSLFVNLEPDWATLLGLTAASVAYGYLVALKPGKTLLLTLMALLAAAAGLIVYPPARAIPLALLNGLYLFWNDSVSGTLVAIDPLVSRFFLVSLAVGMGILTLCQALRRRDTFWPLFAGLLVFGLEWLYYFETAYVYFLIFIGLNLRDLAKEVAGDGHPYEQALVIEDYLRRTFAYTLDTPPTPRGRDFVDYFLFDLKQGYCTYYSSAMVVMLRSLSIPARWVQGFVVSPVVSSGSYEVSNDDAHAWVEAYFPGYGWLTFDPTPRFTPPERRIGAPAAPEEPGSDQSQPGSQVSGAPGPQPKGGRQPWDEELDTSAGSTPKRALYWALLPSAVVLYLLGYWVWLRRTEMIPERNSGAAVHRAFANVTRLLGRFGIRRDPGNTVSEFSSDVVQRWPSMEPDRGVPGCSLRPG